MKSVTGAPHSAEPPHPFRAAPWYDPRLVERPPAEKARLAPLRLGVVIAAGVVLPIVSVAINHSMQVVDLGVVGVVFCLASVASVLFNLLLVQRRTRRASKQLVITAPRSTAVVVLLLASSLLSALWWAYLALLFLPILPISLIAVLVVGIGFCGLCPFFMTAISLVQAVRAARELRTRVHGRWVVALVAAVPSVALGVAVASTAVANGARRELSQRISAVVDAAPFSTKRMGAIDALRGKEELLLEAISREDDHARRVAIAEAYERLMDGPAAAALRAREPRRQRRNYPIRPFFFLHHEAPLGFRLADPFGGLRWL